MRSSAPAPSLTRSMVAARSPLAALTVTSSTPAAAARSPKVSWSHRRRSSRRAVATMTRGRAAMARSTWMRPIGPAPMTTVTPPRLRPVVAVRALVRSGCERCMWCACELMMQLMGSAMAACPAGRASSGSGSRQPALEHLLADEDVLGQQAGQRIADRDLGHASAAVGIALEMVDGREVDGRLHRAALADRPRPAQPLADLHDGDHALVADDGRVFARVPAVHQADARRPGR